MKPKFLLFGGKGFVGKNFNKIFFDNYQIINSGSDVDVTKVEEIEHYIAKNDPHYVINLASITTLREVDNEVSRAHDVIYNGNKNILNSLKYSKNILSYLYVSSSEVYDSDAYDENFILVESSKVNPSSSNYAKFKLLSEGFCLNFKANFYINIARPFTHIGPYQSLRFGYARIINELIQLKKSNKDLSLIINDLDSFRDLTNVDDICKGYELLIKSKFNKEIFNFCSSKKTSMRAFIKICETIFNEKIMINSNSEINNLKNNYSRKNVGSYQKAFNMLDWKPKKTLQDCIRDMITLNSGYSKN